MAHDKSEQFREEFAARALDVTPPPLRDAVRVLYVTISVDPSFSRQCAAVLSSNELQRADRFAAEIHRRQFIQRRAFRRFCGAIALDESLPLEGGGFEETSKGRPYLPELPDAWFSFSSCRCGLLGAWSLTRGIGVDLEDRARSPDALELARRYFSEAEAGSVARVHGSARQRQFLELWCLKEAALKSIGEGLPFGLDTFQFSLAPNPSIVHAPSGHGGAGHFEAHLIDRTCGCAAVVTRDLA